MLRSLSVQDFALIQKVEVTFQKGFTAVTGETGAGKSILFDAIGFLLGKRADAKVVREGASKAIIEAEFDWNTSAVKNQLHTNAIEVEFPLIIRREIRSNGRSRAFINDTPVSLTLLEKLAKEGIDLHQQNSLHNLLTTSLQLGFLDEYAGITERVMKFSLSFENLKLQEKELEELKSRAKQSARDQDYFSFLVNEINELAPVKDEEINLEAKQRLAENSEEIKRTFIAIHNALEEEENSVLSTLRYLINQANQNAENFNPLKEISERLKTTLIELEDLAQEASHEAEQVQLDEEEMQLVSERLGELNKLFLKHGVGSADELILLNEKFESKLQAIDGLDEDVKKLEFEIEKNQQSLNSEANEISELRKAVVRDFELQIIDIAKQLGLPHTIFQCEITAKEALSSSGKDQIQFLFSANKGTNPKPLKDVASGGELSRIMLALKSVVSGKNQLSTLIFDEIDSGISGDVAGKFGNLFFKMGKNVQVVSITHLPQVAAKASHHLHAQKFTKDKSSSKVKYLNKEERIIELAKMLSSNNPTKAAKQMAEELLEV